MTSIKAALEISQNAEKPLISLTFPRWHLLRRYNTKRKTPIGCLFSFWARDFELERPTEEVGGSEVKNNWVLFLTSETEPSKESTELSVSKR